MSCQQSSIRHSSSRGSILTHGELTRVQDGRVHLSLEAPCVTGAMVSYNSLIGSVQGPRKGHAQLQDVPHSRKPKVIDSSQIFTIHDSFPSQIQFTNVGMQESHFYHRQCCLATYMALYLHQVSRGTELEG